MMLMSPHPAHMFVQSMSIQAPCQAVAPAPCLGAQPAPAGLPAGLFGSLAGPATLQRRRGQRVLIIEMGFGRLLNPYQTKALVDAGFQIDWVQGLPNPEKAMDSMKEGNGTEMQILAHAGCLKVQEKIISFRPHVLVSASKGAPYMMAAWDNGIWTGPSLMINRHPLLQKLPPNMRVIICQGSRDETYPIKSREELEALIQTGAPNQSMLFYTGDGGYAVGDEQMRLVRYGDSHNQLSLLKYDCLPRLVDALLATHEAPDVNFMRTGVNMSLSPQRLQAEAVLGLTPEAVMAHWQHNGRTLVELPVHSQEFQAVVTLFKSKPKVARAYDSPLAGIWASSNIVRIERVENALQMTQGAVPYFASLKQQLAAQGVACDPGVHTRWAFHGTTHVNSLVHDALGFRPSGAHAEDEDEEEFEQRTTWGAGTYFARDAEYCVDGGFCQPKPNEGGVKKLLLCLLAVGNVTQGDPSFDGTLPIRHSHHRFNAAVDCLHCPEIYITHLRGAAYPAYMLSFL